MPGARRAARGAAAPILALALGACTDLAPVRDFGRSAATLAAFPQAGAAYVDSAVASEPYVRTSPASFVAEPLRARQVRAALALQAELGRYFALLAKLAGDTTFSLDAEVDAMGKSVFVAADTGLPKVVTDAALTLARVLVRFSTANAQLGQVQALVRDGGPSAMRILEALQQIDAEWTAQMQNDAKQVDQTLQIAVLPSDVPPLLRLLAEDRRAQLRRDDAVRLRQMRAAQTALAKVRAAHDDMAAHLDELGSGPELRARLERAALELRSLRRAELWPRLEEAAPISPSDAVTAPAVDAGGPR